MTKHLKTRRSGAAIASIAMALALAMGPAISIAYAANDVPEWAVDGDQTTAKTTSVARTPLPSKFDLRTKGVVTPVKCQDPWQDCWAFGGIAAAEISILSDLGITYADTVQAGDPYNLSERHLAWFASHPVTQVDDPEQVDEGTYTYAQGNGAYDMGGTNMHVTTLLSQGVGPVPESMFPYRGTDGSGKSHTYVEAFTADPTTTTMGILKQRLNTDDAGVKAVLEGMHAQYNEQ